MKYILLLTLSIFLYTNAYSCSCAQGNNHGFCQVVGDTRTAPMFCVVQARVVAWYYWGMRVKVLDNIRANPNADTIIVWGDNGACCRPPVAGAFQLGDTIVMCLEQTDFMGNMLSSTQPDYELPSHYVLQGCGTHYMRYKSGKAIGAFDNNETPDTIEYDDFKTRIYHCIEVAGVNTTEPTEITSHPNPASDIIKVTAPAAMNELLLYNSVGQCVLRKSVTGKQTDIDLNHFAAGIYTLTVYSADRKTIWRHRIVRQ